MAARLRHTLLRATLLALVLVLAAASPASAALVLEGELEVDLHDGRGFVTLSSTSLFDGHAPMVPGESRRASLVVRNGSNIDGPLIIAMTATDDLDDGCTRPEISAGDVDCGAGGSGDAARWTRGRVSLDTGAGPQVLWDGPFAPDPSGWQVVVDDFEPGTTWELTSTVWFDPQADNTAQSDRVTFDLLLAIEGNLVDLSGNTDGRDGDGTDGDDGDGGSSTDGDGDQVDDGGLAITGGGAVVPSLLGAGSVGAGWLLLALLRRRRDTDHASRAPAGGGA